MTITRQDVEQVMDRRVGAAMELAGMSTGDGNINPWLTDPLRWALYMLGYTSTSIVAVTDSDLADVPAGAVDALLDLCELRTLEAVRTNYIDVTTRVGQVSEDKSDYATALTAMIEDKRKQVAGVHDALLVHPLTATGGSSTVRIIAL